MKAKFKYGLDVFALVGLIFTIVGAVNTVAGIFVGDQLGLLGVAVFIGLGLLFVFLGLLLLLPGIKRYKKAKKIFDNGYYIKAPITEVGRNYSVKINGRPAYVIYAEYRDIDGKVYMYRSRDLVRLPANLEGQCVHVYVIPPDYSNYYMDINHLMG